MASSRPRNAGEHTLTTISLMVLIGVELFAVALSGGWAIAALYELGDHVGYALMGVFSLGAARLLFQLWQKTTSVDPNA